MNADDRYLSVGRYDRRLRRQVVGYRGDVRQLVDVGDGFADGCTLLRHVAGGGLDDHVTDVSADAWVVGS
jgi:hypothetical protein